MEIYTTVKPQELLLINQTDFFNNAPLNILFKFNNNAYKYLDKYTNIQILVDSGAYYFNALNYKNGDEQTFQFISKYMNFIKKTLDDERIIGYFDMDLRYIGLNNIQKIRKKLFEITDKIIPVYHISWGEYEFKKMCKQYGYIGFPSPTAYKAEQFQQFVKYAHKHHCRIHGLGMDRDKVMKQVPFDSTDSAMWFRRAIAEGYYFNHNIPKNKDNNKKYQPIYLQRELLTQWQRQAYYQRYWQSYHQSQIYKPYGGFTNK